MKIKVRTLQNNEEELNVDKDDTVLDLKKKVESVLPDMPYDKQKLIFSGKILKDENKAMELLNENDIVIVMVTRKILSKNNMKDSSNNTSSIALKINNKQSSNLKADSENTTLDTNENTNVLNNSEKNNEESKNNTENAKSEHNKGENNKNENDKSENLNNTEYMLLTGEKLKETIENICAMGFERERVEKEMISTYNNPNRVIDNLINRFPSPNEINENIHEMGEEKNASNLSNILINDNLLNENPTQNLSQNPEFLRNSPFFNILRDVALSNPQRIPEIIEMIGRSDPSFLDYIREHQDEFLGSIQNYSHENAENEQSLESSIEQASQSVADQGNENYNIPITPLNENEMESIKKLESLGFPKHIALEAFIACDKNEEMAANYLFENTNDFLSD